MNRFTIHLQSVKKQRVEGIIVQESGRDAENRGDGWWSFKTSERLPLHVIQAVLQLPKTKFQIFNAHQMFL